jgi:RNA polymerase sigma factor (sigma-70 family)
MNKINFNKEYNQFVTDHHGLVFSFLKSRGLDENDFYDVVIFGFLKAVKDYLNTLELSKKYEFSTIAYKSMRSALHKHYITQNRQKRKANTISFENYNNDDGDILSFHEVVSGTDSPMIDFETELLLLELASRISKREMDVIRMKIDGYGVKEIAKAKKMPMKGVTELLAGLRDIVLAVCYE